MNFFRNFFNGKRNTENSNIKTPKFIGSEDDFTKFIGPYSRNLVQRITKSIKLKKDVVNIAVKKMDNLMPLILRERKGMKLLNQLLNQF